MQYEWVDGYGGQVVIYMRMNVSYCFVMGWIMQIFCCCVNEGWFFLLFFEVFMPFGVAEKLVQLGKQLVAYGVQSEFPFIFIIMLCFWGPSQFECRAISFVFLREVRMAQEKWCVFVNDVELWSTMQHC